MRFSYAPAAARTTLGVVESDVEAEIERALAVARSSAIEAASEALTALERRLAAEGDDARLADVCSLHAELLLQAAERIATAKPTLELRETALRKATRAVNLADEGDKSARLKLRALRVKVDALRSIPGREPAWREASAALIAMLEGSPNDSRWERARRWHDLGLMAIPRDEREWSIRASVAETERCLRRALDLGLELGEEGTDYAADVAVELAIILGRAGALHAIDELAAKVAPTLPARASDWIRARAEEHEKLLGGGRVGGALRMMADRIDARLRATSAPPPDAAPPPPARPLTVGDRVRHARYGEGTVAVAPTFAKKFAEIAFDDGEVRKMVEGALTRVER